MKTDKASLQLRAQEILNAHPEGMTTRAALKQAILERYGDDANAIADALVTFAGSIMSALARATFNLPEDNGSLFQIPSVIGVPTEEGDKLVGRAYATNDQVEKWLDRGLQHHSTQRLRFKRAKSEFEQVKTELKQAGDDDAGSKLWVSSRAMLCQSEDSDE